MHVHARFWAWFRVRMHACSRSLLSMISCAHACILTFAFYHDFVCACMHVRARALACEHDFVCACMHVRACFLPWYRVSAMNNLAYNLVAVTNKVFLMRAFWCGLFDAGFLMRALFLSFWLRLYFIIRNTEWHHPPPWCHTHAISCMKAFLKSNCYIMESMFNIVHEACLHTCAISWKAFLISCVKRAGMPVHALYDVKHA